MRRDAPEVDVAVAEADERTQFAYPPVDALAPAAVPSVGTASGALPISRASYPARLLALATSRERMAAGLRAALELELERGTAYLLVPVFLALGAIVYFAAPREPGFLPLLGAATVAALFLLLLPSRRVTLRLAATAMLLCIAGALLAKTETWRAGTRIIGGEISTQLTGRVVTIEAMASGRVRLTVDVESTARPVLRYAPDRVRVSARKVPPEIRVGSQVQGIVSLIAPSGPVRPGSYDFSFESYFDGIGASGYFMRGPELLPDMPPASGLSNFSIHVENARNAIAKRIRDGIDGPEGEIAAALVVGVRAGIPDDISEAMRRTGIYHIISISGLHMALVAGTVMGTLRVVFALFPAFASRRPVKKYAAAAALAAIAAYLFISGAEVAAQRSFIMLAIMLIALLFDRAALTLRNLATSAIIVIVISPHEVIGPSFQMSFAATAALVGAYAIWSERRSASLHRTSLTDRPLTSAMLRKSWGFMAALAVTSIVAGLATAVFGAYHFQRVSPLSLVANLAVMPIVSVFVMPFAVAGSIAMPFGLDGPFFFVMAKGLAAMIAVSRWLSQHSPVDAVGLISVHSVVLWTVALVIATMATTRLRVTALPFALVGLVTVANVRPPDILVSEDARLVAVPVGEQRLAVNRARPNEFTIENWQRALRAEKILKPDVLKMANPSAAGTLPPVTDGFVCDAGLCLVRHVSGAVIAHALDAASAKPACGQAAVVVVDDATASNVCENRRTLVVTKRELARYGSAAIQLSEAATGSRAEISFAISRPYRPWHTQRRFSREARGLPPYRRKAPRRANASNADATTSSGDSRTLK
ncbi:ComEC/Rec2 family competence protein [Pseudaminobacter sp. NGMCC 1.201702]|uniref:ComEC/Rec2 family competence protein n=1 Tax=Pseudaminobacter sp. NGMCC 1.201702 TaxID=3391825 RepID=UPI0039EE2ABE